MEEPKKEPEVVSIGKAEMGLYLSGVKRGHAEALRQVAGQLREAAETGKKGFSGPDGEIVAKRRRDALIWFSEGYGKIAEQIEEEAGKATAEQTRLLARYFEERRLAEKAAGRSIVDRVREAAIGALGGWRGR